MGGVHVRFNRFGIATLVAVLIMAVVVSGCATEERAAVELGEPMEERAPAPPESGEAASEEGAEAEGGEGTPREAPASQPASTP